jgi:hypothetical protein
MNTSQVVSRALPTAHVQRTIKLPTTAERRSERKSFTLKQTTFNVTDLNLGTAPDTHVVWNIKVPPSVGVEPRIQATYGFTIRTVITYAAGVDLPQEPDVLKALVRSIFQYQNLHGSVLNKMITDGQVTFDGGYSYYTRREHYFINQLFKSSTERAHSSSFLNNCNIFFPRGCDPEPWFRQGGDRALAPSDSYLLSLPGVQRDLQYVLDQATRALTVTSYNLFTDTLELEPFFNSFNVEGASTMNGLNNIDIRFTVGGCHGTALLNPLNQAATWTLDGLTAADYTVTTAIAPLPINLSIDLINFLPVIKPLTTGLQGLRYTRLEVFNFPSINPSDVNKQTMHVKVTSIPHYFVIMARPKASGIWPRRPTFSDANDTYGEEHSLKAMSVRVQALGDRYEEFNGSQLQQMLYKHVDRSSGTFPMVGFYYNGTVFHTPIIVFDPILDLGGEQRAAGMAAALEYEFKVYTDFAFNNPVNYQVIAVHQGDVGSNRDRWLPGEVDFTQRQVNEIYSAIQKRDIELNVMETE